MTTAPPLATTASLSVREFCAADRELLRLYTGDEETMALYPPRGRASTFTGVTGGNAWTSETADAFLDRTLERQWMGAKRTEVRRSAHARGRRPTFLARDWETRSRATAAPRSAKSRDSSACAPLSLSLCRHRDPRRSAPRVAAAAAEECGVTAVLLTVVAPPPPLAPQSDARRWTSPSPSEVWLLLSR